MNKPTEAAETEAETRRQTLRGNALRLREAIPQQERSRLTARIEAHLDELIARLAPTRLAFCWPYRGEPDLVGWVARWLRADPTRQAALPVVQADGEALAFCEWSSGAAMVPDRYGIPIPADRLPLQPEAALIPLSAFDAQGYRLGYGGGFFDRTLSRHAMTAIGVGFEISRVASVLPQPHDRPMDWLITEAGIFSPVRD